MVITNNMFQWKHKKKCPLTGKLPSAGILFAVRYLICPLPRIMYL